MKDIGRGVTHKTWIVEVYLQMHSVSEIVERTHHSGRASRPTCVTSRG